MIASGQRIKRFDPFRCVSGFSFNLSTFLSASFRTFVVEFIYLFFSRFGSSSDRWIEAILARYSNKQEKGYENSPSRINNYPKSNSNISRGIIETNRRNFLRIHCVESKRKKKKKKPKQGNGHESTSFLKMYHIKRKVHFLVSLWILFFWNIRCTFLRKLSSPENIYLLQCTRRNEHIVTVLLRRFLRAFIISFFLFFLFWLAIRMETSIDRLPMRLRKVINVLSFEIRSLKLENLSFNHR